MFRTSYHSLPYVLKTISDQNKAAGRCLNVLEQRIENDNIQCCITGRALKFQVHESLSIKLVFVICYIILRWMFRKLEGVVGTGWRWLRIGMGGGHL
jgi:hypothetical protein